jgi:hypothetical protein
MRARGGTTRPGPARWPLGSTDSEANEWFEYLIAGAPTLLIRLAEDVGTGIVQVRVRGDMGEALAARIDTAIDLL